MIYVTERKSELPIGTKIHVSYGGFGAGLANGKSGAVCARPDASKTWPEYAGEIKEKAVLFVSTGDCIYGLSNGCQVELINN